MSITLSGAIQQIREDLQQAVVDGKNSDIIFTPTEVEIELAVTFTEDTKASGGVKVLAVLAINAEEKNSQGNMHKVKISLAVSDRDGNKLQIASTKKRNGL